jgi:vitamin B12 transporter
MDKGISITLLALLLNIGAVAQKDTASLPLEEVVVTANRFPQKQNTTGKVVTVIDRPTIERSLGVGLVDLLNRQAGIAIAGANNNLGTNPDVYLRGSATGNVLILLDGVPMYDVSTIANTFDLNHIPLDNLERIEILKGAQSTPYGSDAVAGVIHLITRKEAKKPFAGQATASAGSFGTFQASAGLRGQAGSTSWSLQMQHRQSKGFSAAHDSTGKGGFDQDGFRQQTAHAELRQRLGKGLTATVMGNWGDYRTDLDAGSWRDEKDQRAENRQWQAGAGLEYRREQWSLQASYRHAYLQRRYLNDSADRPGFTRFSQENYEGMSDFAEAYGRFRIGRHAELLAGIDKRWQATDQRFFSVSSFGPYENKLSSDSARIGITGAFASLFLENGKGAFLETGLRYNRHSRFGDHLTYTVNPSWSPNERTKLFLNLSSAFKAPSLYQLYDANVGERSLRPEISATAEGGVQATSKDGRWNGRMVVFAREIRNGIDFDYVSYRYYNYNRQTAFGGEIETSYRQERLNLTANYSYVKGEVNTVRYEYDPSSWSYVAKGDTAYDNLFRRPRHSLNLTAGFKGTDRLFVQTSLRAVSRRLEPRFMDTPMELEPYATVDLHASYRIGRATNLFLDIGNLFDKVYFDVAGFNARRRFLMAGIRVGF